MLRIWSLNGPVLLKPLPGLVVEPIEEQILRRKDCRRRVGQALTRERIVLGLDLDLLEPYTAEDIEVVPERRLGVQVERLDLPRGLVRQVVDGLVAAVRKSQQGSREDAVADLLQRIAPHGEFGRKVVGSDATLRLRTAGGVDRQLVAAQEARVDVARRVLVPEAASHLSLEEAERRGLVVQVEASEVLVLVDRVSDREQAASDDEFSGTELLERRRVHRRDPGRIVDERRDPAGAAVPPAGSVGPARVVGDARAEHGLVLERGGVVRGPGRVQSIDPLLEDVIAVQLVDLEVAADVERPALVEPGEPRMAIDHVLPSTRISHPLRNPVASRRGLTGGERCVRSIEQARVDFVSLQVRVQDRGVVGAGYVAVLAEPDLLGVLAGVEDRGVDAVIAQFIDVEAESTVDGELLRVGARGLVEAPIGQAELAERQITVGKVRRRPRVRRLTPLLPALFRDVVGLVVGDRLEADLALEQHRAAVQVAAVLALERPEALGLVADRIQFVELDEPVVGVLVHAGLHLHAELERVLRVGRGRDVDRAARRVARQVGREVLRDHRVVDDLRGEQVELHRLALGIGARHGGAVVERAAVAVLEAADDCELTLDHVHARDSLERVGHVDGAELREIGRA
jgi:hypothetical protein